MGDVTATAFGVLGLLGLALVGIGAVRGGRFSLVVGGGLRLALVGASVVGLPSVALGLIALAFVRRRPSAPDPPPTGPPGRRGAAARAAWSSPASPPS